jgi:trk system potassium uptake protein TrkH
VTARAEPRGWVGRVDVSGALNLVGVVLRYLSVAFLFPVAIALWNGEAIWPFLAAGALTGGAGWALEKTTAGRERIGLREAFFVVAVTWLVAAFFVSLPYLFSGQDQLSSPLDAYFEAMSGMTTTGATILTDVDALPRGLAMWRQLSQWLGGMGIIVLALAVLPRLRVGGRQLLESELPGPEVERLSASIRTIARRLWVLYAGLTVLQIVVLAVIGWTGLDPRMTLYNAVAHSFTTLPTGGFSTHARSIEYFGAASQWAIAAFMAIAGVNFALIYRALRRHAGVWRDEELRLYVALLAVASAAVLAKLLTRDVYDGEEAVRQSVFQVVSMMTTTGFASADFNAWPIFTGLVLVLLMLIGGSAGSTAGAIKVVRVLLLGRILRRELDQTVHREAVVPIRFNGVVLDERTVRGVGAFILLYGLIFVAGVLGLAVSEAVTTAENDLAWEEGVSAVATTLGNVGPGLGFLGPMGSFEPFSPVSKVILIVLMWAGRLELLPVVVLLTRGYWRR